MSPQSLLDLTSLETYSRSCLNIAAGRLADYSSIAGIAEAEDEINAYPNLDELSEPRDIRVLDVESISPESLNRARQAVLGGRIFWEHTAAGEATRLGMGTKFLIEPEGHLNSLDNLARLIGDETKKEFSIGDLEKILDAKPKDLFNLNMGLRHLLQLAFDINRLAIEVGDDPARVLARQKMLLILNQSTADEIISQLSRAGFCGFERSGFLFMIQPGFPGINLKDGGFYYDPDGPARLHNHGQLVMQETMDGQIFRLDENSARQYLDWPEFRGILEESLDKVSFNIEDLDYLTASIDWPSLALALELGEEGFNMVMEIVANNPEHPQKGGMAAFDKVLGRNVMIESFQLKGLPNTEIKFLNKNFNHYTNPEKAWTALKEKGLPMPIAVKSDLLYFQPVQGDINFLVPTAFVRRKVLKPIRALKSASNLPATINAMRAQDLQPGFLDFARNLAGDRLCAD